MAQKRPAETPLEEEQPQTKKPDTEKEEGELEEEEEEKEIVLISVCDEEPCTMEIYMIEESDMKPDEDQGVWEYLCTKNLSGKSLNAPDEWLTPVGKRCNVCLGRLIWGEIHTYANKKEPISAVNQDKSTMVPIKCRIMAIHSLLLFF